MDIKKEIAPNGFDIKKTFFEISTDNTIYRAHSLDEVMRMWKEANDPDEVKWVSRIG